MPDFDYDVIVIGSGFGGSVSALRLTEKGYRVGVLEAGRRWDSSNLPKTNWRLRDSIWAPRLGLTGCHHVLDPPRGEHAHRGLPLRQGAERAVPADRTAGRRRPAAVPALPAHLPDAPDAAAAQLPRPPGLRAVGDPARHAVAGQLADQLREEARSAGGCAPGRGRARPTPTGSRSP